MRRLAWVTARHTAAAALRAADAVRAIPAVLRERATELRAQAAATSGGGPQGQLSDVADLKLAWADLLDAIADTLTRSPA